MPVLFYILIVFIGYAVGRIGHIYLGHLKTPHHWIFGLILVIAGLIFYKYPLGELSLYFGAGHFISDFNDFLQFRFFGKDQEGEKRFWGFD